MSGHIHSEAVRQDLTRNIPVIFDDLHDEMVKAFEDLIPATSTGMWHFIFLFYMERAV